MLDIDITLLYQIIGFLVLLFILNRFLYAPIQKVLAERSERIEGTFKSAAEAEEEVRVGMASYEQEIKEAVVKGHEERAKMRLEAIEQEKEIIEDARRRAASEIAAMKAEIESSKRDALAELEREARGISASIAEKILERKVIVTVLVLFMGLLPVLARAAEEAAHHGAHEEGPGMTWKIVNFVVLVIGIGIVWKKFLKGMLERRSEEISKALEDAKAARAEAEKLSAEYREKLGLLETRVAGVREELKQEGRDESAKILADARAAAEAIMESAKAAAAQEVKKARLELRAEAARLAVSMAEDILKKEIKDEDQKRLVRAYLDEMRLN